MVLDFEQRLKNLSAELERYTSTETLDSYRIVENINISRHPTCSDFCPGPIATTQVGFLWQMAP